MEKLRRAKKDKKIAGVCGGLGQALKVDSSCIRLIFLVLAMVPPFSTLMVGLVYTGLALALPKGEF